MAADDGGRRGGILVVEDDLATWRLETEYLAALGLELRRAATAEEAEAELRSARPALLVLDYLLPGCTAPELLARLRAAGVALPPFLVVSGCPDYELEAEARRCGAAGWLVKDAAFLDKLLPAVKRALTAGAPL